MVNRDYFSLATKRFKSFQGNQVTVAIQRTNLVSLQTSLLRTEGGKCPLSKTDVLALEVSFDAVILDCRSLSVSLAKTKEFLMNLESFVISRVALIDDQIVEQLVKDIIKL